MEWDEARCGGQCVVSFWKKESRSKEIRHHPAMATTEVKRTELLQEEKNEMIGRQLGAVGYGIVTKERRQKLQSKSSDYNNILILPGGRMRTPEATTRAKRQTLRL
ncbi:hypothetical protein RRF57_003315 [Xylaria bambusicola]|uniref:Uncharacterized protein n=1 Tax=Xylaria bambusicola TaxID=326684 RepID=A0AAN7U7W2_9PEZI